MRYMLALAVALGCIQSANAASTGMDLQRWCSAVDDGTIDGNRCDAYMLGFVHALSLASDSKVWCLPDNLTRGQSVLIVRKWMRDNPEELHQSAGVVASRALLSAFACKKRAK